MEEEIGSYDDFLDALGERESSDNYQLVNEGFLGRYQISEVILVFGSTDPSLRYYNLDQNPSDNVYNGTWTGLDGVESLSDFLNNETAQDNLIRAWFDNLLETFEERDVLHYAGQTIDGIDISVTGMLAGAHLIGYPELIDYLEGPKVTVPEDQFGTPVTEYLELFSDFEVEEGGLEIDRTAAVSYTGSPGNDSFIGGGGDDTITGGDGIDTARYTLDGSNYLITRNDDGTVIVRQTTGDNDDATSNEGTDTLMGIERVQFADQTIRLSEVDFASDGTFRPQEVSTPDEDDPQDSDGESDEETDVEFEEVWVGTEEADRHAGGSGSDDLDGIGGNDTIGGRGERDLLEGGEGNDILGGGVGADTIRGGDGNDRNFGGDGNDSIDGGEGNDVLVGRRGRDDLQGSGGDDSLFGNQGNDALHSGHGDDRIRGGAGNDTLNGLHGEDGLRGGRGDDLIAGSLGDDTVIGGEGEDEFVFDGSGFGNDRIVDFEVGVDKVNLTSFFFADFESLNIIERADAAVLVVGKGDRVRFNDVDPSELTAEDFIL